MRSLTLMAMTLLLVGCAAAPSQILTPVGDVSVSIAHTYCEVTGSTTEELRAQMDQLGYADESGDPWDAYTEWYVSWTYPYSVENNACTTGHVEVTVEVTFLYPKWEPPAGTSQELIESWNAYLAALENHEEGHKEIAIAAGYEVLHAIDTLPAYETCDELELAADGVADRVLKQHRQQEASYDQETEHGAAQGARFPSLAAASEMRLRGGTDRGFPATGVEATLDHVPPHRHAGVLGLNDAPLRPLAVDRPTKRGCSPDPYASETEFSSGCRSSLFPLW